MDNWRELKLQVIWAYDGRIESHFRHAAYSGEANPAWLIREGSVTLRFPDGEETYSQNTWVFPRLGGGQQDFSHDARILSVRFLAEWPNGQPLFDRSRSIAVAAAESRALTRLGERLARRMNRPFSPRRLLSRQLPASLPDFLEVQRLHYGWLVAYVRLMQEQGLVPRSVDKLDDRVGGALNILEMRALHLPPREAELAELCGVSKSQLNRLFVANIGKTPAEYWDEKRLRAARLFLLETRRSIKSIAYEMGFNSLPHFSAWVRRKFGASPREIRDRRGV